MVGCVKDDLMRDRKSRSCQEIGLENRCFRLGDLVSLEVFFGISILGSLCLFLSVLQQLAPCPTRCWVSCFYQYHQSKCISSIACQPQNSVEPNTPRFARLWHQSHLTKPVDPSKTPRFHITLAPFSPTKYQSLFLPSLTFHIFHTPQTTNNPHPGILLIIS